MNFVLLIVASPATHQATASALRFAQTALHDGHKIKQVFFYADGVHALLGEEVLHNDSNALSELSRLADRNRFPLLACEAAALRRGLGVDRITHLSTVKRGTLGQLMGILEPSDRLVTFA